jgi:signal peptidase II
VDIGGLFKPKGRLLLSNQRLSFASPSRWILPALVFCSCLGCDQWSKKFATEHLKQFPPTPYLGDTFRIQYAENPGAFLGAGGGLPEQQRFWLLVVMNAVVLVAIPAVLIARSDFGHRQTIAVSLLLAGGIGNLIDRVFNGGLVIDFLNMGVGPLRTGIFNVADMAIMAGFALLILQPRPKSDAPNIESAA